MPTTGPSGSASDLLAERLLALLPKPATEADLRQHLAFAWRVQDGLFGRLGHLEPIVDWAMQSADDLLHLQHTREAFFQNLEAFVRGFPFNHVLLTGARGTGKSSLVRAGLHAFANQGLRMISVDREDLRDLELIAKAAPSCARIVVFTDDLAFEAGEAGYKTLKAVLDGGLGGAAASLMVVATSNRRHLMPEPMADNLATRLGSQSEIHPGEAIEEKISLADRFGLWLSFTAIDQDAYLDMVNHHLVRLGLPTTLLAEARQPSLNWATQRGSRSGRIALAFAKHWVGQWLLRQR